MLEGLFICTCIAVTWLWLDGIQCKDIARAAGKRACDDLQLQLLDDTVANIKTRLSRNQQGSITLLRYYRFEFTQTGEHRYKGTVQLLGHRIKHIHLDTPDDTESSRQTFLQ
ncbi:DUF3301 domain-containing protein [Zooshikella ganghwensis]|uniref:DUF3301 domain-containing protein n=1 Tax=Zooshikella ganghwensis TaxID=202772 RepID=A0A4P9VK68_9GAMM|nr:DUF3301 domain-containing protein [Zooshikella ganghwensis]RDH42929.1 DUF3301 domain-containing protein [Zooshikella ganghwensis]